MIVDEQDAQYEKMVVCEHGDTVRSFHKYTGCKYCLGKVKSDLSATEANESRWWCYKKAARVVRFIFRVTFKQEEQKHESLVQDRLLGKVVNLFGLK